MKKFTLQEIMSKTFLVFFTCILLSAAVVMSAMSSRLYRDSAYQLCEQFVSTNLDLLNNRIMDIQKNQEIIAGHETVRESVRYYQNTTERDYAKELNYRRKLDEVFYMFARQSGVSGAYIIDKDGEYLYFYRESLKKDYNMRQEAWYSTLTDDIFMNTSYVSGIHDRNYLVNEKQEPCISMVMPIQGGSRYTFSADAFLVCDVDMNAILNGGGRQEDIQFAIVGKDQELYAGSGWDFSEQEKARIISKAQERDVYAEIYRRSFLDSSIVVSMKSKMFGWRVIGVKNLQEITDMNLKMVMISALIILIAVILVQSLSRRVSRRVLQPMNRLMEECNRVAEGDSDVVFSEKPSQEIAFLSDTIKSMVDNVVQLTNQVVEEEKKVSEEKLRVLQHQINPHFLNNVLQTIKALAVEGDTDKISRMSTLLGHILAYSVYEPYECVPLRVELEYLKQYIELQNIRYEDRILYSIDCEEQVAQVLIPKLTLQPLVENSIEHGFSPKTRLMINVSAEREGRMVCIYISDNGLGIGEQDLQKLREQLVRGEVYRQTSGIGVVNVNERLKRKFGDVYGVEITSNGRNATTVILKLPMDGEDTDEGIVGR